MPLLYVCCPEQRFSRNRYLTVGLAPLIVLDLLGVALLLPAQPAGFAFLLLLPTRPAQSATSAWAA